MLHGFPRSQSVKVWRAQVGAQAVRHPDCALKHNAVLNGSTGDAQKETAMRESSKKEMTEIMQHSDLLGSKIRERKGS